MKDGQRKPSSQNWESKYSLAYIWIQVCLFLNFFHGLFFLSVIKKPVLRFLTNIFAIFSLLSPFKLEICKCKNNVGLWNFPGDLI